MDSYLVNQDKLYFEYIYIFIEVEGNNDLIGLWRIKQICFKEVNVINVVRKYSEYLFCYILYVKIN